MYYKHPKCCKVGSYEHTAVIPINNRLYDVDTCIAGIVRALNEYGIETAMSCCGHGNQRGIICLKTGESLIVCDKDTSVETTNFLCHKTYEKLRGPE